MWAIDYASERLQNDPLVILSMTAKRVFGRFRWPRLVKTLLQFERDDAAFAHAFEPGVFGLQVDDAFMEGGDEVGPQPSALWNAITNKKRAK
jgi:hypothetical protein